MGVRGHLLNYPIQLNLQGRRCVVIGGGRVAERKVAGLMEAGAVVRVIAPQATEKLRHWADSGTLHWQQSVYQEDCLDGAFLVVAATDNREVNVQITRDAQERNLLVCCVDAPEAGNWTSPSVVTRGDLALTVSTGGKSPTLAAVLREQLEEQFGPEWAALTELIGGLRESLQAIKSEAARKDAVRTMIGDRELIALLQNGQFLEAEARARQCLSSSSE